MRTSWLAGALLSIGCGVPPQAVLGTDGQSTTDDATSGEVDSPPVTTDTASTGGTSGGGTGSGGQDSSTSAGVSATDGSSSSGSPATSTTDDPSTTSTGEGSSSDGIPDCVTDGECGANETCTAGACVSVCAAWGSGTYETCLGPLGNFDTVNQCGMGNSCLYWGNPIQGTGCSTQGCATACDCPAPPATGDAIVTCADITSGDMNPDCYLSCENGETCPDGMSCVQNIACLPDVVDVPLYGNCGNLASGCATGTCVTEGNHTVCISACMADGDCGAAPAGAAFAPQCDGVINPPDGVECHLPCNVDGDCPPGMDCYDDPSVGGVQPLCMWPLNPKNGGDCCMTHFSPGCSVASIEACTCALDSYCCSTAWDGVCVDVATDNCAMACP